MKSLSATYPVWFCDVWGVLHNGYEPFAAAVDCLKRHRQTGGTVLLLTNSPRTASGVERQLADIRVPRDCWDAIVTSGDVTRVLMLEKGDGRLFHLGPDRDLSLFEGLDVERVAFDQARSVICTGLFREFEEKPDDYLPQLRAMLARKLPMICANPDKVVRKGEHLIYCAGALAELYIEIGGTVFMAGKPYRPIYELAMRVAAEARPRLMERSDVLAIGDGIATDIKGASDFGLPSVMISGGINENSRLDEQVQQLAPNAKILTSMDHLDWGEAF